MLTPKVYADFQNLDDANRVILSSQGTVRDLERQGIELREGLGLTLSTDDEDDDGRPLELLADAIVRRDPDAGRWVAAVDWSALRHEQASPQAPVSSTGSGLRILEAEACGPHHLRLTFSDGVTRRVDLAPLLRGPIFEPLRDPAYFARVEVDEDFGAVRWPNGADFAPEALHELADVGPAADRHDEADRRDGPHHRIA